jgi:hypothetical protein
MAYMLSAQLAAMRLNVSANPAVATTLIYAPGLPSLTNTAGFATVQVIMDAANAALVSPDNVTIGASAARTYQELLKNALDSANNNLTFVQSTPCPRTFE